MRERAGDGVGERSKREAGLGRSAGVDCVGCFPPGCGDPERNTHPRRDSDLEQPVRRDPGDVGADAGDQALFEQATKRDLRSCGVERATESGGRGAHKPSGEVADIDELKRIIGLAGGQDPASLGQPAGRVHESLGAIVWSDDEPGPRDGGAAGEGGRATMRSPAALRAPYRSPGSLAVSRPDRRASSVWLSVVR